MATLPTKIQLEVVTPERMVLSETVDEVSYKAAKGYVGILPGHVPMLTTLEIGVVSYKIAGQMSYLAVSRGFAEVLPDRVILLADTAEKSSEIDRARAEAGVAAAEGRLKQGGNEDHFRLNRAHVEKELARLTAVSRH